jgi:hypothetical protein
MAQSTNFSADEVRILEEEHILLPSVIQHFEEAKNQWHLSHSSNQRRQLISSSGSSTVSVRFKQYVLDA